MKLKLTLLCLLGAILSGCVSKEAKQRVSEYPRAEGYNTIGDSTSQVMTPLKMSYEGHDYIIFYRGYDRGSLSGIVHDPDCQCHEPKKQSDN